LRGAAGYLLVVDGTRVSTWEKAQELKGSVHEAVGAIPMVLILNKCNLAESWELPADLENRLAAEDWLVVPGSAKTGEGVEEAFAMLAARLI
jgi:hypothetical protein